jgi:tetratricopeptide (TPR) repeat protein
MKISAQRSAGKLSRTRGIGSYLPMLAAPTVVALLLLQAADFNEQGRKALEAQKYEEAAGYFAKAIEADARDFTAHFHLALADSLLKKDAEAIAEYRKVLELKPDLYEAQLNLGIILLRQKQAADAVPYLEQAAERKPKEFRPRFYLAESMLAAGDAVKAGEHYKVASEIDPKSAAVELGLGRAEARQDRLGAAAPHFRRAAELDKSFRDALLELAALYEKAAQPAEAIAIYREFPENPAAQERLGELLLETRKYADAIPSLEAAYQKDATPANRLALAAAYQFNRQADKAAPLFAKAVAGDPENYEVRMMYARVLRDLKQYPPAAQQFYEALKRKPQSREAWSDLAGMLYLMENYTQALAALDKARQLGEETPANYYFHAITYDKLHDLKPALEYYQKFLASSQGKNPDEEFKARQRARIIQKELSKR